MHYFTLVFSFLRCKIVFCIFIYFEIINVILNSIKKKIILLNNKAANSSFSIFRNYLASVLFNIIANIVLFKHYNNFLKWIHAVQLIEISWTNIIKDLSPVVIVISSLNSKETAKDLLEILIDFEFAQALLMGPSH